MVKLFWRRWKVTRQYLEATVLDCQQTNQSIITWLYCLIITILTEYEFIGIKSNNRDNIFIPHRKVICDHFLKRQNSLPLLLSFVAKNVVIYDRFSCATYLFNIEKIQQREVYDRRDINHTTKRWCGSSFELRIDGQLIKTNYGWFADAGSMRRWVPIYAYLPHALTCLSFGENSDAINT